jgi:hypothetical protein
MDIPKFYFLQNLPESNHNQIDILSDSPRIAVGFEKIFDEL